jgi:phosphate-selective porin OprO/OprP
MSKIRFLNTGKEKEVDHAGLLGLEGVIQLGPVHIQGEYMQSDVTRLDDSDKADYSVSGGYVFGSFFITGDHLPYDIESGEFGRLVPQKKFGAIELLVRYSWLDLNDLDNGIEGGYGENVTFGLTWYFNPNIKFLVNYTIVDHDQYADADGDWDVPEDGFDYNILAARFLITL